MPKTLTSTDIHGNEYGITPSQLFWRPAAYALVVHDGHILLTSQHKQLHLPGGGIELGEMPEEAVVREVREETGFAVGNPRLVNVISGFFSYDSLEGDTKHAHSILLYYQCDFLGGEASIDGFEESERLVGDMPQWVPIEELDAINAGSTVDWRQVVQQAVSDLGFSR